MRSGRSMNPDQLINKATLNSSMVTRHARSARSRLHSLPQSCNPVTLSHFGTSPPPAIGSAAPPSCLVTATTPTLHQLTVLFGHSSLPPHLLSSKHTTCPFTMSIMILHCLPPTGPSTRLASVLHQRLSIIMSSNKIVSSPYLSSSHQKRHHEHFFS